MLQEFQSSDYSFESINDLNDNLQYIDFINHNYSFKEIAVEPNTAFKYQGNLFGLFKELSIEPNLFVFTMYLNGYTNPIEFTGDKYSFKLAISPPIPKN